MCGFDENMAVYPEQTARKFFQSEELISNERDIYLISIMYG